MQVFEPASVTSYIQFKGEMTISLTFEIAKKATG
jgi:hypothetical protein